MPCLIALIALFLPRLVIILLAIFSTYISTGFAGTIAYPLMPILGFIFLPYTTLAYAFAINSWGGVDGWGLVLIIVAVLLDLGSTGGGASTRRTQYRVVRVER